MNTTEILTTITAIFTAFTALAALITCFLTFRSSRPSIIVNASQQSGHMIYLSNEKSSIAIVGLEFKNSSPVAGMIDNIYIAYNGKKYYAETSQSIFDFRPTELKINLPGNVKISFDELRLKCPVRIDGCSFIGGFFIIPDFPKIQTNTILADIYYELSTVRKEKIIKGIQFFKQNINKE